MARSTRFWSDHFNRWFDSMFEYYVANLIDTTSWYWVPAESYDLKVKVRGQSCLECGAPMYKIAKYTPDFGVYDRLTGRSLIIEAKGGSVSRDSQTRMKRYLKEYKPDNFYIVAKNDTRLSFLTGKPKLSEWCEKHGAHFIKGLDGLERLLNGNAT